jgi:hypothetical protein
MTDLKHVDGSYEEDQADQDDQEGSVASIWDLHTHGTPYLFLFAL